MRIRQRPFEAERGQALVLTTLFMTVLLGFAAFAIDFGVMANNKRQLQNAADAAALAGAWQLPDETADAVSDAYAWAVNNDVTAGEVTQASVGSTSMANDTMTVSVARPVNFLFGRVLGLTNQTITATATARLFVATGFPVDAPNFFPFAVWAGNSTPYSIPTGNVIFRSNSWGRDPNVLPNPNGCESPKKPADNCNYDITSNTFKGYFHWQNSTKLSEDETYIDYAIRLTPPAGGTTTVSQGGNAFGTAEIDRLAEYYAANNPIVLPVINYASDKGSSLTIRIIAFVCVHITQFDTAGSVDWRGDIVQCNGAGEYGGTLPPEGFPYVTVPVLID